MSKTRKENQQKNKYVQAIKQAYYDGYKRGFEDSSLYPNKVGSASAGSAGYKDGIRDRRKQEKFNTKLSKASKIRI